MEIMQTVMPQIKAFIEKALGFVTRLREMDEDTKKLILKIAAFAAMLGPVIMVIGMLATAMGALLSPVGLVILGIAALGTAAFLLYKNWEKVVAFLKDLWQDMADFVNKIFQNMKLAVLVPVREVLEFLIRIGGAFQKVFKGVDLAGLEGALSKINTNIDETHGKIEDLGPAFDRTKGHMQDAGVKIRALADKVKGLIQQLKPLIKGGGGQDILGEIEKALDEVGKKLDQETIPKFKELNRELIIFSDLMGYDRIQAELRAYNQNMEISADAMDRVREQAEILRQKQEAVADMNERANDEREREALAFASAIGSMQLYGQTLKGFIAQTMSMLLKALGQELLARGALAFLPGLTFNPAAGILAITAGMAAIAASQGFAAMQEGGVVTKPTLALIGESGPEAVIPLNKGGAGINVNVYGSVMTEKDLAETLAREMKRQGYFRA
jgi:hypothetical protein